MRGLVYLFFIFLACDPLAFGGGASDAGNGGGIAEKNIIYAYAHLDQFITLCLKSSLCRTDTDEDKVLENILKDLDRERKVPLVFKTQKENPKLFKIGGLLRVAKTGDHVSDPIYINQDLLYTSTASAVDVPLALSILIHELGHHEEIKDHDRLDRLGSKIQSLVLAHEERSEFWNGNSALVVFQYNSVRRDEDKNNISKLDALVLENNDEIYDLTSSLLSQLKCPNGKAPSGLRIYNVSGTRGIAFDEKSLIIIKPFQGWFIEVCEPGAEYDHGDFKLSLSFKKVAQEKFHFLSEKVKVSTSGCKDHTEVCK